MPARVHETGGILYDMPVDTLLLSPSPPGLGHCFPIARSRPSSVGFCPKLSSPRNFNMGLGHKGDLLMQLQRDRRRLPLRSCIKVRPHSVTGVCSFDSLSASEKLRNGTDIVPNCGLRTMQSSHGSYHADNVKSKETCDAKEKKKVSFADSKGLSLHTVKFMDGPSNMPPKLRIHLLEDVIQNEEAKPTHPYTYVPAFEQPASNYLEFRDRLEKEMVCLENVLLKDNITVVGTVKVKNISFEKSVTVRTTFDNWKTHRDVQGSYVFPSQASNSHDKYDTFSFEVDVPPNQSGRGFEFCICYTVSGNSFWDNNRGNNYKIITEKEKDYEQHKEQISYQHLRGDHCYGQFSYWQVESSDERPYW